MTQEQFQGVFWEANLQILFVETPFCGPCILLQSDNESNQSSHCAPSSFESNFFEMKNMIICQILKYFKLKISENGEK